MIRSRIVSVLERADAVDVGSLCVIGAVAYATVDGLGMSFATVTTLFLAVPAIKRGLETADIGETTVRTLLGGVVALLGFGAIAVGGTVPIGIALGTIGCWIVLDGLYDRVHGEDAAGVAGGMSALTGRRRRVIESLREASRPLTVPELRDRTGLDGNELEATLEAVAGTDGVERIGNGYTVEESAFGARAFVSRLIRGTGSRLVRPLGLFNRSDRAADR